MSERVGPVLTAGPLADAVVAAIRAENVGVEVLDRGAYLRVSAAGSCRLVGARVEALLGEPFELPGDLEAIMPSFAGKLSIDDVEATWSAGEGER